MKALEEKSRNESALLPDELEEYQRLSQFEAPATGAAGSKGIWRLDSCQIQLRALPRESPLCCLDSPAHRGSSLFVISTL